MKLGIIKFTFCTIFIIIVCALSFLPLFLPGNTIYIEKGISSKLVFWADIWIHITIYLLILSYGFAVNYIANKIFEYIVDTVTNHE